MNTPHTDDRHPDLDALASEYVLGTLEADKRREVQRRLHQDAALRDAVDAWERRLHHLTERVPPQTPSPYLWTRIARSLESTTSSAPAPWWSLLGFWRGLAAAGVAASLALLVTMLTLPPQPAAPSFVVVLVAPQDKAPGWVVQASDDRQIQLIPLAAAEIPADMALQFWTKADSWQGPVSLGLVQPGQRLEVPLDQLPPLESNQLFELTLEKSTGSPTGKPTGPIQFIGRAVKVI